MFNLYTVIHCPYTSQHNIIYNLYIYILYTKYASGRKMRTYNIIYIYIHGIYAHANETSYLDDDIIMSGQTRHVKTHLYGAYWNMAYYNIYTYILCVYIYITGMALVILRTCVYSAHTIAVRRLTGRNV